MRLGSAVVGVAVIAGFALASPAEEEESVVTLTSGITVTGKVVSKAETGITLRVGTSDVVLPSKMVVKVEKYVPRPPTRRPAPEPEPEWEPEPEPEPTPARGGAGVPEIEEGTPPRPAAIILRDGSVIEGYVVARSKGVLWIIPSAEPMAIPEKDISDTVGNAAGGQGGFALSGDVQADARRMIDELASGDQMRSTLASTVLDKFGAEAAPVLIEALKHENSVVRRQCILLLQNYRVTHAFGPVVEVLRKDADAEVRTAAAAALVDWNTPETRRLLLDVVLRDRAESVKLAALNTLSRCATIEEAATIFDLLIAFDPGTDGERAVFVCLRRSTGQQLADDRGVWRKWWLDDGGREDVARRVEKVLEERGNPPPRSPDEQ